MRSHDEVLAKLEEVRSRKLHELRCKRLKKSYGNCVDNIQFNAKGHGRVGLCQNDTVLRETGKDGTRLVVCNDDGFCDRCPFYRCKHTEETVLSEFESILRSPARCGDEFPKLAVLIWVLAGKEQGLAPGAKMRLDLSRLFSSAWRLLTFRWCRG